MYQMDLTVGFSSKYLQYFEYTSALRLATYINKTVQYYSRQAAFCSVILVPNAEYKFCCLIIVPLEDVNLIVDKECMVVWKVTNNYVLQWFFYVCLILNHNCLYVFLKWAYCVLAHVAQCSCKAKLLLNSTGQTVPEIIVFSRVAHRTNLTKLWKLWNFMSWELIHIDSLDRPARPQTWQTVYR